MRMRYYTGETWVEGENEQAEVIDSLIAEVRREERELLLEKVVDFFIKKGFGYVLKTAQYDEFVSSLS